MSLQQYQEEIDDVVVNVQKSGYWQPLAILARTIEEVGEVSRILNHTYGEKPKKPDEPDYDLGEEVADIMYALICLANREGINLDDEMAKVINKARTRDKDRFKKKNP
jgi:NTP pyrophosphatase (non-canonical NTP hydrolase)